MFIALNVLAWMIGCAVGEAWILKDERRFGIECDSGVYPPCVIVDSIRCGRQRAWPNSNTMLFNHDLPF
jgi:hypothetical protein